MADVTEEMWEEYRRTRAKELRNEILKEYMVIVKHVVNDLMKYMPLGMERDDLHALGSAGLLEAIERFEKDKGASFKTYAGIVIKGAILDGIRSYGRGNGSLSRTSQEKSKRLEAAVRELEQKLKRYPSGGEIREALSMTKDEYGKFLYGITRGQAISIDKKIGSDENLSAVEVIANEQGIQPEEEVLKEEMNERLMKEIMNLPEKERRVISYYYFDEKNLREIGYLLGKSEGRISQIHTNAIAMLKTKLMESE